MEDLPQTNSPLTSFAYKPKDFHFMDQTEDEEIILFLRWHPITNLGWVIIAAVVFIAPPFFGSLPLFSTLSLNYQMVLALLWYLMATAYVYEKFLHWFFSVFLVTNKRVMDVDFINLIYREVAFASLDKIQDVTVKAGGAGMTIFNYGDVLIQTAGEIPNIEFERIPYPDKVAKVLKGLILKKA